jgi:hypothetical protein
MPAWSDGDSLSDEVETVLKSLQFSNDEWTIVHQWQK